MTETLAAIPRWGWMWALAVAIFATCKAASWIPHRAAGTAARSAGYLILWPGMDARSFLDAGHRPARPGVAEWLFAAGKTLFGSALMWLVAPLATAPLLRGWIGLVGMIFILHFGTFHLVSLAWRRAGVQAEPIMRAPVLASSLGDLWGKRWNLGFRDLAHGLIFARVAPRLGTGGAALAVFVASGLVHDLVISVPAGGGYGLPTAYFLLQGVGVLAERKLKFSSRLFAILVAAGPAYFLFHPTFVRNVFLPFMEVIS